MSERKPQDWELDVINVARNTMADVVREQYRGVSRPSSLAGPTKEEPPKRTQAVEVPLKSPPGTALLDKYFDAAAAGERRRREALAKKLNEK
jgi:hypothetical protein